MITKRISSSVVVPIALAFFQINTAFAGEDILAREAYTFIVKYKDGDTEKYLAKYTAKSYVNVIEHGGTAKPFEGRWIDTRRCEWNMGASISREICLVSKAQGEICPDRFKVIFDVTAGHRGFEFELLHRWEPDPCSKREQEINQKYTSLKERLKNAYSTTIPTDKDNIRVMLKTNAVAEIESK